MPPDNGHTPVARYTIGSLTTKDLELWQRVKALQQKKCTLEIILRRGVREIESDIIKTTNA